VSRPPGELAEILRTLARGLPFHQDALREAADLLDVPDIDGHIIEFREGSSCMQHPLACRPNLMDCPTWQTAVAMQAEANTLGRVGKYRCSLDPATGLLAIGERVG
jgi:hypothetical protein